MALNFLALNEVNFDLFKEYEKANDLPGLRLLRLMNEYSTHNNVEYEYLEPWIQWVTVHTGLKASEHRIFRLGDPGSGTHVDFFQYFDDLGYKICAISPMNTKNKISSHQIFVPDPWTDTVSDNSFWSRSLTGALRQTVNDNSAGKITLKSYMILIIAMIKFIKFSWYPHLLHLMLRIRGRKWNKALILDLLLYNMFISRRHKGEKGFNYLFLNAFAHVQHHYLLNSPYVKSSSKNPSWYLANENDPVRDAVITYDRIIHDFILRTRSEQVLVGTGLTQIPYDKAKFYYRLKDHENFLVSMKLNYVKVRKGMTRDFYVDFACNKDRDAAMEELQNISLNEKKFFGDFSVNNCTLFCSLVYPSEILVNDTVRLADKDFKVLDLVNFVAIKNGMHHDRGFLFLNIEHAFPEKRVPLERVHYLVKSLGNKHIS